MRDFDDLIQKAKSLISQSPFQERMSELVSRLVPSFRLTTEKDDQCDPEVGSSRMGGRPDLPTGWQWPRWDGYDHSNQYLSKKPTPLSFISQLNLRDLPKRTPEVPDSGLLYFFFDTLNQPWGYDPQDKEGFRVLYFDGPESQLSATEPPEELQHDCVFAPCKLTAKPEVTLPEWLDECDHDKDGDNYQKLLESLSNLSGAIHHRFLGHPQSIQGDMQLECQLVTNGLYCGDSSGYEDSRVDLLRDGAKEWQLLLQVDTDEENPGWMWGDCGRIYYWIRRGDLAERAFENSWMCLQCF